MKRALALLMVLALAAPARAHFVWVAPQPDGTTALLVFSDSLEPDANVAITKIQQTTIQGLSLKGQPVDLTKKDGKDCYTVTGAAKGPFVIQAECKYGVLTKGTDDPFLLMYHAKGVVGLTAQQSSLQTVLMPQAASKAEFDVVLGKSGPTLLFRGKPAAKVEVVQIVPGREESVKGMTDENGAFKVENHKAAGVVALRFKLVENQEGELNGKPYKQVRHYFTLTVPVAEGGKAEPTKVGAGAAKELKADAVATKLLADARAARAVWNKFPGFSADLEINRDGQVHQTKVQVSAEGKVNLDKVKDLEPMAYQQTKREISSLVGHRLPGGPYDTPCAFADSQEHHPQGRLIHILNDELHSSYRIRERQILEVNRVTGDTRFTISVLDNAWTKEKQCLPTAYVVNTWEVKSGVLKNSRTHFHTWTRLGDYDLPESVRVVAAHAGPLEAMTLRFSNIKLGEK